MQNIKMIDSIPGAPGPNQTPTEVKIFTNAERIQQLNDIDKVSDAELSLFYII